MDFQTIMHCFYQAVRSQPRFRFTIQPILMHGSMQTNVAWYPNEYHDDARYDGKPFT